MVKRLFDFIAASAALIVLSPVFLIAALGILLTSSGPVLYRARRIGLHQKPFIMYKFRTMHIRQPEKASVITGKNDPRIFGWGLWLRRLKIDELPQLFNVLKGEMAIVGPRPEAPEIVENHYAPEHLATLTVLPGLASLGSLYNYTHGESMIEGHDPETWYVKEFLPEKMALELLYVREVSFLLDLKIILRTIWIILKIGMGNRNFSKPPELARARPYVFPAR